MCLPKFRSVVFWAVSFAVVIPLIVLSLAFVHASTVPGPWVFLVWPGSIVLTAAESVSYDARFFAILALRIAANVLLYVILFTFLWSLGWVFRAWRASLRDGTTI